MRIRIQGLQKFGSHSDLDPKPRQAILKKLYCVVDLAFFLSRNKVKIKSLYEGQFSHVLKRDSSVSWFFCSLKQVSDGDFRSKNVLVWVG